MIYLIAGIGIVSLLGHLFRRFPLYWTQTDNLMKLAKARRFLYLKQPNVSRMEEFGNETLNYSFISSNSDHAVAPLFKNLGWNSVKPSRLNPVNMALAGQGNEEHKSRSNILDAAETSERLYFVLSAVAKLTAAARSEGFSLLMPRTIGTQIRSSPRYVQLGTYLDFRNMSDVIYPADNAADIHFGVCVRLIPKATMNGNYGYTVDGSRPPDGFCAQLLPSKPGQGCTGKTHHSLHVQVPISMQNGGKDFHRHHLSFLALFDFVRQALLEPSKTILMTLHGYWYKELPFPSVRTYLPLSPRLLNIAANAAHAAGLIDAANSIAYGALTWRVQRQFAGTAPAPARLTSRPDEGGFLVGCQFRELALLLRNATAHPPYSRYRFAVVSDLFATPGHDVAKADPTSGPSPGVARLLRRALDRLGRGDFASMAGLFGEAARSNSWDALGRGDEGVRALHRKDPKGKRLRELTGWKG